MARLDARWNDFSERGQTWYHFWQATETANVAVAPAAMVLSFTGAAVAVANPQAVRPDAMAGSQLVSDTDSSSGIIADQDGSAILANMLTWGGSNAGVVVNVIAQPSAMSMTFAGSTPAISTPVVTQPSALPMTFTGSVPAIATPILAQPSALATTFAGSVPAVAVGDAVHVTPAMLNLALTLAIPTVTVSGGAVAGGHLWHDRFIPFAPEPVVVEKKVAAKKRKHDLVEEEARAILAVAMLNMVEQTRRLTEDDWLLELLTDEQYARAA